ncbi:MAG: hypothetical protein IJ745_04610 [Bacteroidales bacterium]|nr:hypothetical protein [Bacteroidales bacterium]
MKKVLSFIGSALFVAALTVSCGNNNTESTDTVCENDATEAAACCEQKAEQAVEAVAASDADADAALMAAAKEAGEAICNCANGDAASIEKCMKSIIAESYAAYQNNDKFTSAVKAALGDCVKEKAKAAVAEKANEGIKAGAEALSNALKK